MKKVLFAATVDNHIIQFHLPFLKWFKEMGYEVHVASKGLSQIPYADYKHNVSFERSPFKKKNIKAHRELKNIIKKNNFNVIHCHTPTASVLTRINAFKTRKYGTKVLYTAHGFHFYKGAPLKNWFLYFPIEFFMANFTDAIITINKEDYNFSKKYFSSKKTKSFLIPGVGVDENTYTKKKFEKVVYTREEIALKSTDFILIYAAELNKNKNQLFLIKAMKKIADIYPEVKLLLAGTGDMEDEYIAQVKRLNLERSVKFLGFRDDLKDIIPICDVGVSSSKREGLALNVIEYAMCGLPLLVSRNRGHLEIVRNNQNGFLFDYNDEEEFMKKIVEIYENKKMRNNFSKEAASSVKKFGLENALNEMKKIYKEYI
ncbi:glycosyltransferase family 4 protein [Planococcus maritimus]|uniref:Glycosyltransferase family 4 protein n=1 Tax=Planococcus maritimus TaxID=192421 RepID=A0A7D7RFL5_PLAMR|nr:glycosyltransferase family 4 protein [Planococcus maritimus]QMT16761.1 glycosyltransferase family 4 protein [Planococcus maritimus]